MIPTEGKTICASIIKITYLVMSMNKRCLRFFRFPRRGVEDFCVFFWDFTQRRIIVSFRLLGQRFGPVFLDSLTGEGVTDMLSGNIDLKKDTILLCVKPENRAEFKRSLFRKLYKIQTHSVVSTAHDI